LPPIALLFFRLGKIFKLSQTDVGGRMDFVARKLTFAQQLFEIAD